MKISKNYYNTFEAVEKIERYNMVKKPYRQKFYLRPLTWLLSFPESFTCKTKIIKNNMKGLKPPFLLLCNHNSFIDFKITTRALFPKSANYVVAIDGFINREGLLRKVGAIGKRKFVNDVNIVNQIKHSLFENKTVLALYPEARYSYVGTNSVLPESLYKMIKLFPVPVVTLISHGNHLRQPFWNNLNKRKVPILAEMTQLFTKEDLKNFSVKEIKEKLDKQFSYDDYKYQNENNIKITEGNRAEGLNKVLYQCPNCKAEYQMNSKGTKLWCEHCKKSYVMNEFGELQAEKGITEFSHIPDWFEWQRENVKKQVYENNYSMEFEVNIDSLPNSRGFYRIGKGTFLHNEKGITVTFKSGDKEYTIKKEISELYSIHTEFFYFGKGDAVVISTLDDTFYMFPSTAKDVVTKVYFGVEELYKKYKEQALLNK